MIKRFFADWSQNDWVLAGFWLIAVAAYFWNLGYNLIWTPNEGFYAEAVREMLESGDFVNIMYNYEPRFNKPPLLYWLIALSAKIFGLNEFAIRLPSALTGLGTVWLVYQIGRLLDDRKTGVVSAIVMMFSFQFAINARYASPAVALTFFFTLTLFWFLRGYHRRRFGDMLLAYVALGLTVLTKGYPYIIVIGGIVGAYLLFYNRFQWRPFFRDLGWLKLWLGLPVALLIGMSWILYMTLTYGDAFTEVLLNETFRRAFTREASLKPFFYLEANTWGFLPYSLTFYIGLIYLIARRFREFYDHRVLMFGFAWFIVMLIIFTAAKGKIPTYFIQGHPGMSLFTAWFMLRIADRSRGLRIAFDLSYWIPGVIFSLVCFGIVYIFEAHPAYYLLALIPPLALFAGWKFRIAYLRPPYFPFYSFAFIYLLFSMIVSPFVEQYRKQEALGKTIKEETPAEIPILLEEMNLHSLPYYAERKIVPYLSPEAIREREADAPILLIAPKPHRDRYPQTEVLWEGLLYDGSETRTLELILNCLLEERGEQSRFKTYVLLYRD